MKENLKPLKTFKLASPQIDENCIRGAAAVMGNMDRGGDVIYPGAFKKALKGFLASGFVSLAHNWDEPIAMPTMAKESGNMLDCEAEFHSTEDAQRVRDGLDRLLAG